MRKIKVGLAGFGRFSVLVFFNMLNNSPWELVAIAEISEERRNLARQLNKDIKILENYQDLVSLSDVEVVIISLPSDLHADAAILAFQQGKHVYLEKPIATSYADAKQVIKSWKDSRCNGMIGLNYRFHPLNKEAKKYFSEGKLNDIFCVRSSFASPLRNLPKWQHTPETGGGALLHLATHHVDLIRFILSAEVKAVFSSIDNQKYLGDTAFLQLFLDNGITTQSFFSHSAIRDDIFHFYGKTGKFTIDRYHSFNLEFTKPDIKPSRFPSVIPNFQKLINSPLLLSKLSNPRKEPSYQLSLNHFAETIVKKIPPSPNLWDGYQSLLVVEAAKKSAREGMVVNMEEWTSENTTGQ